MELAGRHVVVTGAASGIGLACATSFAEEGARVSAADLNASGETIQADVGKREDVDRLIATAERSPELRARWNCPAISSPSMRIR